MKPLAKRSTLDSATLSAIAVVLAIGPLTSSAGGKENFLQLQQHLSPDTADILENLSMYSKLWISVPKQGRNGLERGNCVWSECALDDQTDDAHMGDYRDGDENWYQYRTQSFCANAAYSLYGIKRQSGSRLGGRCAAGHFINSFFTYEGADTLLKALGVTPQVYYQDYQYYGKGRQRERERRLESSYNDTSVTYSNADCVQIEYQTNDKQDQGNQRQRYLAGSQDQNQNNGYSSSLGCDATGHYIVAAFQGSSCDGNYFLASIDSMDDYNDQHNAIGCRNIWTGNGDSNYTTNSNYHAVYALLKNSWACDPKLYPNECPDPHGEKGRYEYALRIAAQGGNGLMAYKNDALRTPIRTASWLLFALTVCVWILTYFVKNRKRVAKEGHTSKGNIAKACVRAVKEDVVTSWKKTTSATKAKRISARRKGKATMDTHMDENEPQKRSHSEHKNENTDDQVQSAEPANDDDSYRVLETQYGREGENENKNGRVQSAAPADDDSCQVLETPDGRADCQVLETPDGRKGVLL